MSKLKMLKFEAVALQRDAKKILEQVQKIGVAQLESVEDERLFYSSTNDAVAKYEKTVNVIDEALEILSQYGFKTSLGMLSGRKEIDEKEFYEFSAKSQDVVKIAYSCSSLIKRISDLKAEIVKSTTKIDVLNTWRNLDIPLAGAKTKSTVLLTGTFPKQLSYEEIKQSIALLAPDISEYDLKVVYSSKEITCVVFAVHNDSEKQLSAVIRSFGFAGVQDFGVTDASFEINKLEEDIKKAESDISDANSGLINLGKYVDDLLLARDYFTVKADEYNNLSKVGFSSKSVVFCGYVPEICREKLKKTIDKHGGAVVFSEVTDEDNEPVLLSNTSFSEGVEGIVEMYALPSKKDIDPTSIMSFFYYFLFGMMLSDAGYGLLMVLGTAFVLLKTKVEGSMRKTMKMFFWCGVSTVIWGALFGSWFGDIYQIICTNFLGYETAPSIALWFEPIKDPIKLLLFSFMVGIVHLFLGLGTFGYLQWKNGDKVSAIFDTVPIMLTVLGAAPLAGSILMPGMPKIVMDIAKYVAIAGVVLIVLTNSRSSKNILARLGGGLYALYNIASGYLSDILSYSRLLALGLATGSIASVVNMMGAMPSNLVVKGILLTIVFIVGHTLNMAINVLGAYVHTNRLQFVELFAKFYEGGGRPFEPLKFNTKFFKLKEEIKND